MLNLKPKILAVLPGVIPSTFAGVIKPMYKLYWNQLISIKIKLEHKVTRKDVMNADVVIFCRNCEPYYSSVLRETLELKKSIIYELDDNFFELPLNSTLREKYFNPEREKQLQKYIESSSLVRVYSEQSKKTISAINPNVVRVDGPIDWDLLQTNSSLRKSKDETWIVYATSRIEDEMANIFLEDIKKLLLIYPNKIKLFFWGYYPKQFANNSSVRFIRQIKSYDRFFRKFSGYGFDIGLAPLFGDKFHLSKSNNKFREYSASGIAGVYSNVQVYSECVEDGVTGLLVENRSNAWFDALNKLINEKELCKKIQEQAYNYARQQYSMEKYCKTWHEHIQSVLIKKEILKSNSLIYDGRQSNCTFTLKNQKIFIYEIRIVKFFLRVLHLIYRFSIGLKVNGIRNTFKMVAWSLTDFTVLFKYRFQVVAYLLKNKLFMK